MCLRGHRNAKAAGGGANRRRGGVSTAMESMELSDPRFRFGLVAWKKYTDEELAHAVAQSTSVAQVMRTLGIKPAGGSHLHISKRIRRDGLDTSHFLGQAIHRGKVRPRLSPEEILIRRQDRSSRTKPDLLRRALAEIGVRGCCAICGVGDSWCGRPLVLHVDHIDGDASNNLRENLRLLCPNCHSQTATYCRKVSSRSA